MKAIVCRHFGGPEELVMGEWPQPEPGVREILVRVEATALNRADTLQRRGLYPPPPGESPILGLEMAGEVVALGMGVSDWKVGDRVCGLLAGGGYASYVVIHEEMALPVPPQMDYTEAAAIPEVFLTAYQALRWLAAVQPGETVLIHAGASGVGTAAIQLAREMGARSIVTASASKHDICQDLGAETAIDYRVRDFAEVALEHTDNKGVNVIIDVIGGPYFKKNLQALRPDGRMVMLALMGGVQVSEADLSPVLAKRLSIIGSTLRSRHIDYKIALTNDFQAFAWPLFNNGHLRPVIDSVMDWEKVSEAHARMDANQNQGKIVLRVTQ